MNEPRLDQHNQEHTIKGGPVTSVPLSAVAMRAITTDQFGDRELVQCLTLLGVRDPGEFAKFLALTAPKQSYLAARPHTEVVEPREAVNPGEYRRSAISEWMLVVHPTERWPLTTSPD